jgi:hypothetical protein
MTDLSPATQAIIDASNCAGSRCVQLHIAGALRALAARINGADAIRQDILAIAAELEGQFDLAHLPFRASTGPQP